MLTALLIHVVLPTTTIIQPLSIDNADPVMGGAVYGPGGGLSGQQGVIFTGVGTDKDNDGTVSEMLHAPTFSQTPSDSSAPGVITGGPSLIYSDPPSGEKRWEVGYTLVTVPTDEVWLRKCEMILNDNTQNTLRQDFLKIFQKLIYVSGPSSGGGGGGGG